MKRIIASFAAMAAVAVAAPAFAGDQNFTPHGATPLFSGTLDVSQSVVSTTCSSVFALQFSPDGKYAAVYASSFSGTTLCNGLVPSGYPWPVTIVTPSATASGLSSKLRIDNIYIKTSAGYCNGFAEAQHDAPGTGAIVFADAPLAGKIKLGLIEVNASCQITGTLTPNQAILVERL